MQGILMDTDILSIFAKADALSLLRHLLQCEHFLITPGVLNELLVPLEYGYDFPRQILDQAEIVPMTPEEAQDYEALRIEGKLSVADAEMIAICKRRRWIYITMDRVALRCAEEFGVRTVDLRALLEAIKRAGLLSLKQLRALIERMEREDRTRIPFKEALLKPE
ncbi:MAG: hypothetical protein QHJ81_01615 [Anaerolineae bacterium]|nr:hypothetical protein [Anaerolineae bacterium]